MSRGRVHVLLAFSALAFLGGALWCALSVARPPARDVGEVGRPPRIHPDYTDTVIPPNIAPLNFCVDEPGVLYWVRAHSRKGRGITIVSRTPRIATPVGAWRRLLNSNRGEELRFDLCVKAADGRWHRFDVITNRIAREDIDAYVVYRRINSVFNYYAEMSICQRDIEGYQEAVIWDNSLFEGCINCHTFFGNRSDRMVMHIRAGPRRRYGSGMLLIENGAVSKVDTRTSLSLGPAVYVAWHPSGRLLAFSMNKVRQFFHTAQAEVRDVVDLDSDLAVYLLDSQTVTSTRGISLPDRLETWPAWSADGRYLYFCSAPVLWTDRDKVPPDRFADVQYDLVRISYDPDTGTWGEPETVLSARDTGLSIAQPKVSPDGRFLVFCMSEYGTFLTYQPSSDLYMMDVRTGHYERLGCNSDRSDSSHSWSSNSRWVAFASKRSHGQFTRIYFSYVDEGGAAHKPFVLPQKDPAFYDSFTRLHHLPVLVQEPVPVRGEEIDRVIRLQPWTRTSLPVTGPTPRSTSAPDGLPSDAPLEPEAWAAQGA